MRSLSALDEEQSLADGPDRAHHEPVGSEVVALAHAMASSVRVAVELTVSR